MKAATLALAAVLSAGASLVNGQVTINPDGTFTCSIPNGRFCAGTSLQTNIIYRCTGTSGSPGNCNDNLAGVPPVGVKTFAPCWESSPTAGDASCSFNGVVYADNGTTFPVPGAGSSSTAPAVYGSATPSSSSSAVYGSAAPSSTEASTTVYVAATTVPVIVYGTGASNVTVGGNATVSSSPTPSQSLYANSASAKTISGTLAALGLVIAALY